MKKYICYGQHMMNNRGEIFFVSAEAVRRLYGVPLCECIMINRDRDLDRLKGLDKSGIVELYPRYDGVYDLDNIKRCKSDGEN